MNNEGPYSSFPVRTCSVREFTHIAKGLEELDSRAFQEFILTGSNVQDKTQVFVDPTLNALAEDDPLVVARDYDSIIGIADDILVESAISIYPVPNPAEVLSTSIHLTRPVVSDLIRIRKPFFVA